MGIAISKELRERGVNFSSWSSIELDITKRALVDLAIARYSPEVIVNCAAWTDVDGAESEEGKAGLVNSLGAENVAIAWQHLSTNGAKSNISIVRSGNVIGGGDLSDNRLLADVVRSHISGGKLQIRNPKSTRPWQHVLDPLNGYVMAMEKALQTSQGQTFNFGPSEAALAVSEVIKEVQKIWEDVDIELVEPEENAYESKLLDLDSDRARMALSWFPKYSQREAISETLAWWDEVLVEKRNALDAVDSHIRKFFS